MSTLKLLYVDDDEFVREVACMALELDPGFEVTAFDSGRAALDRLRAGYRPDALLLDVMMPELDGPSTLAAIRQIEGCETIPAVFVTARAQAREHAPLIAAGAVGVLTKPFDPLSLSQELRAVIQSANPEGR